MPCLLDTNSERGYLCVQAIGGSYGMLGTMALGQSNPKRLIRRFT